MKAQMFESIPEQKQHKPQLKLQTQPYLTPASKQETLVVSERKKWIESQFKIIVPSSSSCFIFVIYKE